VHGFNGGGNYSAALALNPFAPRGVEHAQASRAWVENMPTEQRAGLERTRGRANSVAKVEGGPSGLAALPGLVEVTISAGTQGPVPPVAVPMPEPASVPESVADAVDLESSQPAPRVLTPDPVVLQLPVNEHAPTGGAI
jgi:hypothetical protein